MTSGQPLSTKDLRTASAFPASLLALVVGFFIVIATSSFFLSGPQVQVDEGSYLLTAATIAGKLKIHGVYGYYSGYSLALVPAFWFASDPKSVYHLALLINALLIATTPLALYRLTRRVYPKVGVGWHVAAAAAATCHSSLLLISQHVMSENALVPLYAWLLATCASMLCDKRVTAALYCGCIGGVLFLVHPRGGAMAATVLTVTTLFAILDKDLRRLLILMWIVVLAIAAVHFPLEHLAAKSHELGGGYAPGEVIGRLAERATWIWIALNLAGSGTEATVASFGMLVVGLLAVCEELRIWQRDSRAATPRVAIMLTMVAGLVVALLMSAVFFVPPQRADQVAYGRYALPAVVPFVAIGTLQFSMVDARRRRDIILALLAGIACVSVMTWVFTRLPATIASGWNFINAPFLYLAQDSLGFTHAWLAIGACFLAATIALCFAAWQSGRAAVVMLVLVSLFVAGTGWFSQTRRLSRLYSEDRRIIAAADAFESITGSALCIELSPRMLGWHEVDFRWRLLNHMIDYGQRNSKQCVRATVDYLSDHPLEAPSRQLVATERPPPSMNEAVGLFVEQGSALDAWNHVMPAVATDSFYPLPEAERVAEVTLLSTAPLSARVGRLITLPIRVTNKSLHAWASIQDGPFPVLLGARTLSGQSNKGEYRARFRDDVAPGASTDVDIRIGPFDESGQVRVNVGVLQERVAWFPDRIDILVDVSPASLP